MALKVKKIKPMYTGIVTTTNRYTENVKNGILIDKNKLAGAIKEYQTVLAVGSSVREVKVGDVVLINPTRYMKKKFDENSLRNEFVENPTIDINIPTVKVGDDEVFLINENDIAYIIEDFEEVPDEPVSTIITKKKTKIIL